MRIAYAASVLIPLSLLSEPMAAQSWTPDLKVGDAFTMKINPYRGSPYTYTLTYAGTDEAGRHRFKMAGHPKFGMRYHTPNMTMIGFTPDGTVPHSFNSNHPHRVGKKWSGTFRATYGGYSREMRCQVDKERRDFSVGGLKRHATRVYCNGRRTDRPRGQVYTMWYDQKTGLSLGGRVSWGSGGYSWEMMSMELKSR